MKSMDYFWQFFFVVCRIMSDRLMKQIKDVKLFWPGVILPQILQFRVSEWLAILN